MKNQSELKSWITSTIIDLVEKSPQNSLNFDNGEKAWSTPLIGFAAGNDLLFRFLKQDIGSFYWLPEEAFQLAYPGDNISAEQLTIISWVIPQTRETKSEQRKQTHYPSERWARSRLFGEEFNANLRREIADNLSKAGFPAVAPMLIPTFQRETSEKYGYASSWSERHTAFIAGLGTFGLSDGLITPVGKAIRCGSVIAKISIPTDLRPYKSHNAYCLYHFNGSCKKCAERCPADAIDETGHNKIKCHDYIRKTTTPFAEQEYNLKVTSCGLCQTRTPCESKIPPKILNNWKEDL